MTDPIADMLTRIRNAQSVRKETVLVPYSKLKVSLANILSKEGYVGTVETFGNQPHLQIKIRLKYVSKEPVIKNLKRISKPGRRVYRDIKALPHVLNDLGIAVISTSSGLMTNKEAQKKNIGGEVICEIY